MKIKDIALKAGVSTATVSNVINGNHHKVSRATAQKVERIITEMGYNPSATARSLASKESRIIGVVIPNLGADQAFNINSYTNQEESPGVIQQRHRGLCDALKSRGQPLAREHIFVSETNVESGARAGQKIALSDYDFTAVAVMSDMVAIGVISGLRNSGVSVPEEVSVIGFDNLDAEKYIYPALTTISQDIDKKCVTAGDLLFRMIENKEKLAVNQILDVELVERQSVNNLNKE